MSEAFAEEKPRKTKKGRALVIVESPAKSKTIKKILGDGYQIEASYGHVRNLPDNVLGFDVHNGFKPTYTVISDKKKVVAKLNEKARVKKITIFQNVFKRIKKLSTFFFFNFNPNPKRVKKASTA